MPLPGSQPLAVFLCEFSDTADAEPQPAGLFREMSARRRVSGPNDWRVAESLDAFNLDGSQVFGCRTRRATKDEFVKAHPESRDKILGGAAAFPEVDTTKFAGVVTVLSLVPKLHSETGLSGQHYRPNHRATKLRPQMRSQVQLGNEQTKRRKS
jgi:hypothetical protein